MRREKRVYRLNVICFLIFMVPINCKLVSFFSKSWSVSDLNFMLNFENVKFLQFHVVFTVSLFVGNPVSVQRCNLNFRKDVFFYCLLINNICLVFLCSGLCCCFTLWSPYPWGWCRSPWFPWSAYFGEKRGTTPSPSLQVGKLDFHKLL